MASRSVMCSPTPATPTAPPTAGPSRCAPPAPPSSRTSTPMTAAPAAPTTAPPSPTATCTARSRPAPCPDSARSPATPPRPDHGARPADRRNRPLQAREDHHRRRRRLPPRHVPRRHGQTPLPATAPFNGPGPAAARDPHPARPPPGLLHPADHHRPARGQRQDHAETRLPLQGAPAVLRPAHRRRADLLHRQETPPATTSAAAGAASGPDRDHLVHRQPARRPQPADPGRLDRPPGPRRPAGRHRAPAQNPPPPPHNTRQPPAAPP